MSWSLNHMLKCLNDPETQAAPVKSWLLFQLHVCSWRFIVLFYIIKTALCHSLYYRCWELRHLLWNCQNQMSSEFTKCRVTSLNRDMLSEAWRRSDCRYLPAEELVECRVGDSRGQGSHPNGEKLPLDKTGEIKRFKIMLHSGWTSANYSENPLPKSVNTPH